MGNSLAKNDQVIKPKTHRKIKMKAIFGRLTKAETEKLQTCFNKMQENSVS